MRALVIGAPVILVIIVAYILHRVGAKIEHRKLIAENERLRSHLRVAESAIEDSDDVNARKVIQYDKLLDDILTLLAGFEGNNPLDLSSNRTLIANKIAVDRPRRDPS